MLRGPEHGPVISLNRLQIKRGRDGFIGQGGLKSVFAQAAKAMEAADTKFYRMPQRVWKVKFVGEGLDDIGGGYSDSISEMCTELQTGALPLLLQTPNGRDRVGVNQDCFILNSSCTSEAHLKVFSSLCLYVVRTEHSLFGPLPCVCSCLPSLEPLLASLCALGRPLTSTSHRPCGSSLWYVHRATEHWRM
jgi:hypothetical protein